MGGDLWIFIVLFIIMGTMNGLVHIKEGKNDFVLTQTSVLGFINTKKYEHKKVRPVCKDLGLMGLQLYDLPTTRGFEAFLNNLTAFSKAGYWIAKTSWETKKEFIYHDKSQDDFMAWDKTPGYYENCVHASNTVKRLIPVGCDKEYYVACSNQFSNAKKPISVKFGKSSVRNAIRVSHHASKAGKKHMHRIVFESHDIDSTEVLVHDVPGGGKQLQHFDMVLPPYAKYNITSYVCFIPCCCGAIRSGGHKITHKASPPPPKEVEVANYPAEEECQVSWIFPDRISQSDILGYKITVESVPPQLKGIAAEGMSSKIVHEIDPLVEYTFKTSPNRRYTIFLQTKGTGNLFSEKVKAVGDCETISKAPKYVPSPGLMYVAGGGKKLRLTVPSEKDGDISCLFVIFKPTPGTSTLQSSISDLYTLENLKAANTSKVVVGKEYIGIAIARQSIEGPFVDVTVGKSEATKCNVKGSTGRAFGGMVASSKGDLFHGKNWGLRKEWKYSITLVTSTPSPLKDEFAVSASAMVDNSKSMISSEEEDGLPPLVPPTDETDGGGGSAGGGSAGGGSAGVSSGCGSAGTVFAVILGIMLPLVTGGFGVAIAKKKSAKSSKKAEDEHDEEKEEEVEEHEDEDDEEEDDSD